MPLEPITPLLPKLPAAPGEDEKEKEELKVPPPPQPPEYFPGFETEVQALKKNIYQANKDVMEAYKKLSTIQSRGIETLFVSTARSILTGILPSQFQLTSDILAQFTRGAGSEEEYQRSIAEASVALEEVTRDMQNSEWQMEVLNRLPVYLADRRYSIGGIEDILALIPNDIISETERRWLEMTFDKLKYMQNVLPEGYEGSLMDAQDKVLDEVLGEPLLGLASVNQLTIEELKKSFQPYAVDMPVGMTAKDIRDVMGYMELEPDPELDAWIEERASTWIKEIERMNMIRAGTLDPEAPNLTPSEFAKIMLIQPMMAGIEALNWYFDKLPRPWASKTIVGIHERFKTSDESLAGRLAESYQYYTDAGESSWDAYALAFNETDMPWYVRLGIEMVFDPTSYIGLGIATGIAKKIISPALVKVGFKAGARVGPLVAALESGYIRGSDALFKVGKEVVLSPVKGSFWLGSRAVVRVAKRFGKTLIPTGYEIPRTQAAMARNFARLNAREFKAVIERLYPDVGNLRGMTAKDIEKAAQACVDAYLLNPTEGNSLMVRVGRNLLEFSYMTGDDASKLLKNIAPAGFDFDTIKLARINDEVLSMLAGQDKRRTAGMILSKLGLNQTDDAVESVVSKLLAFQDDIVADVMGVFKSSKPTDQWVRIFDRLNDIRYGNLDNPIQTHMFQAGETISWVSRGANRVLNYSGLVWVERHAVMPFARWNLLFANFGPMNFLENMQRSFLGGAEIMYPKSYGGVAETNRLFRGLSNAPYELVLAERGVTRMEMALIDPRTGATSVFRNGNIPFVTREVTIGGKTINKTITIRGRQFKITDMQSYNDMWEDLTTIQRAYDYHVHYMKALPDVAHNEMNMLIETVDRNMKILEGFKHSTKQDLKDIRRVSIQNATNGPEEFDRMVDWSGLELEKRRISKELGKTFDKCVDVRSQTKMHIRDDVLDGIMNSNNIDERMLLRVDEERELGLASLAAQMDNLEKEADDIARLLRGDLTEPVVPAKVGAAPTGETRQVLPPQTIDEFLGEMDNINALVEGTQNRIHSYRRIAELRSQNLTPGKQVDDFHVGSNRLLNEFLDSTQEQLDSIIDNLQNFLKARPKIYGPDGKLLPTLQLTEAQQSAVVGITDIYRLETRNVLDTRRRLAEVEAAISRTPPKNRNARFWQQQRVQKADIWDEHEVAARRLRNLRLDASRQFLGSVGKSAYVPANIPPVTDKLTSNHIAHLFGVTGDDVARGLTRVEHHTVIMPREDFTDYVMNQANAYARKFDKSAVDIGFTEEGIEEVYDQLWRNLGIEPSMLTPDSPTMLQLEDMRQELHRLYIATRLDESDVAKWQQFTRGMADDLRANPLYATPEGRASWVGKKEQAMARARQQHELSYPTYDDANIIDETMRGIFPFWTYEAFRWRWMPRTMMRTPGAFTGVARYMDYTDGGYIPVPFTDLQINPLRGSIWMGGMRRLWLKDFPEYQSGVPGIEFLDYVSRAGFYAGIHIQGPIALLGPALSYGPGPKGKPELAEIAPTWMRSGLSALRQLSPEHIGKVLDAVYPDRFRDFQTMLTLYAADYDADEVWGKIQQGIKLTPEEETIWLRAEAKANGVKAILMEQTGMFRIRPEEYENIRREWQLAIEEATGVPVRTQQQIDRMYPTTGKRFSDYYHLDVLQQKMLYGYEAFRRAQGVITPLYPASWQDIEVKTKDYWEELSNNYHEARYEGVYDEEGELLQPSIVDLNQQRVDGVIGPDQWKAGLSNILGGLGAVADKLGQSPAYKDVPKTLEERVAWLEEKGIPLPTYGPDQELLWYYYEIEPELTYNWESDRMELDFDTYYAKIDALLVSLDESQRQRLLDTVHYDWTPLEILYWTISREYFRSYRNTRNVVLRQYTDEQIQAIRRFEVARGAERDELRNIPGPDGRKLISGFQARVRDARRRLRYIDPELDAWSYFWGNTDSFITSNSKQIYEGLTEQYLTQEMVR